MKLLSALALIALLSPLSYTAAGETRPSDESTYEDPSLGKCPYPPGELKSTVKESLDLMKILGPWINLVDEENLRKSFKCYGIRLDLLSDTIVSYS